MLTRKSDVPDRCLGMNFGQAARLAHPIAFGDVFVNGNDGFVGQTGVEKTVPWRSEKVFWQWTQYSNRIFFLPRMP
jgi:hypothetical protein